MKMPTTFTVMESATASRKLLPRDFMARWDEKSFSAARPEKFPSGKKVSISTFALGQTRNAAMNQVRTVPTMMMNGERNMLLAEVPLLIGGTLPDPALPAPDRPDRDRP